MPGKIFVSYSRKDETTVTDLVRRLRGDGFDIWLDRDEIVAGQRWEDEIRRAIDDALAAIVCLSSRWVDEKGYVQKEFGMIVESSRLQPRNKPWLIPVRLDEAVPIPLEISDRHYVDLNENSGYGELTAALRHVTGGQPATPLEGRGTEKVRTTSEFEEWFIDALERGAVIHTDPWAQASNADELAFKRLLKGRSEQGMDAFGAGRYEQVLQVWSPLSDNEYFDSSHPSWEGKPYFGAQIHAGKCQLFMAMVHLNQRSLSLGAQAFDTLRQLVRQPPFSMKGSSPERLPAPDARTQNLNYKDTLAFALDWFSGWSPLALRGMYDIPEETTEAVVHQVKARMSDLDFLLGRFPA